MLALLAAAFTVSVFLVDWRRSRLVLFDYLVLRVTFIYSRLWHRWKCNRPAPFPLDGACLVVANHTCSADPVLIVAGCRFPIGFVVAHEHHNLHPIARVAFSMRFTVFRSCAEAAIQGALRRILHTLESGRSLCLFPEGNLSNVRRNRVGIAKQGIGYLALKTRLPVYPVYIDGGPRTDRLLPSWVFPSPRAARVYYGEAIQLSTFYDRPLDRKLIEETTYLIMERIRALDPKAKARPASNGDKP